MHQHKARQRKGRGSQILPENRAKYWTLNVPIQHPHKKVTGQKTRSAAIKKNLPHRKPTQQEKHKTGAGHGMSQRKAPEKGHDVPEKSDRKTHLEDKDVPLAHHPPQLPLYHLFLLLFRLFVIDCITVLHKKSEQQTEDIEEHQTLYFKTAPYSAVSNAFFSITLFLKQLRSKKSIFS